MGQGRLLFTPICAQNQHSGEKVRFISQIAHQSTKSGHKKPLSIPNCPPGSHSGEITRFATPFLGTMECKLIPECDDLPSTALCGIPPRTGALWSAPRSNHPSQTSLQGTSLRTGFTLLSLTTSTLHAIVFRHKRWAGYSLKHLTAWSTIPSQPTPRSNNRGTKSYIFVYQTVKHYTTATQLEKPAV